MSTPSSSAPEPTHIFVSYSRVDLAWVHGLVGELAAAGITVWLDVHRLKPGAAWDSEIERALQATSVLMVVLSPDSVKSRNVLDEVNFALNKNLLVVPVLYRPCEVPYRVARLQHVDFTKGHETAFAQLVERLQFATAVNQSGATESEDVHHRTQRHELPEWFLQQQPSTFPAAKGPATPARPPVAAPPGTPAAPPSPPAAPAAPATVAAPAAPAPTSGARRGPMGLVAGAAVLIAALAIAGVWFFRGGREAAAPPAGVTSGVSGVSDAPNPAASQKPGESSAASPPASPAAAAPAASPTPSATAARPTGPAAQPVKPAGQQASTSGPTPAPGSRTATASPGPGAPASASVPATSTAPANAQVPIVPSLPASSPRVVTPPMPSSSPRVTPPAPAPSDAASPAPAAGAPPASAAPPSAPASTSKDDEAAVRQAIAQYAKALNDRNVDQLIRVRPDLSRADAQALVKGMQDGHQVFLEDVTVSLDGTHATARLTRRDVVKDATTPLKTRLQVTLGKRDGAWVIQRLQRES